MTSSIVKRRWSKTIGIASLLALALLVSSPWLLREWRAWQGHRLFVEKRFGEASSHLVHVRDGTTLFARHYDLPPLKHLYAQSLLLTGRDSDAVRQYGELADLHPGDGTSGFIVALHEGKSGNWAGAGDRIERHKNSAGCRPCKEAHKVFQAAALAQPGVLSAQGEQEAHLAAMKLPAQCVLYRGGTAAVDAALSHVLKYVEAGIHKYLLASNMSKQAIETALAMARPLIRKMVLERIEDATQLMSHLETNCGARVQIHEVIKEKLLKDVAIVGKIEEWVEIKTVEALLEPYIGGAKNAWAAAPHLGSLGELAIAYAMAYKAESDARGRIDAAHTYAAREWERVKVAAQDPQFARRGVVAPVPSDKSWFEIIRNRVWPF